MQERTSLSLKRDHPPVLSCHLTRFVYNKRNSNINSSYLSFYC
jgi:hypothetical protein